VVVDTSVLIAGERAGGGVAAHVPAGTPVALSAISLMEYQRGVERTPSSQRRTRREAILRTLLRLDVLPLDAEVALTAGRVWVDLERRGTVIPVFDLLIGATALAANRPLLTCDDRHFGLIEGLDVRILAPDA
jgi:predicted nucleic acid-binding protein